MVCGKKRWHGHGVGGGVVAGGDGEAGGAAFVVPGQGIAATAEGHEVLIGRPAFLENRGLDVSSLRPAADELGEVRKWRGEDSKNECHPEQCEGSILF